MTLFFPALVFLVALVQALHFTNTERDFQPPQDFLIQWAYDQGDLRNYGAWEVVIWLAYDSYFPLIQGVT
jgi:hypothetical protein